MGALSYLDRMVPPKGLRVLVTAGASGIGAEIARAFAEAGARVVICDVDTAALDRMNSDHPEITGLRADVSDEAEVAALIAQVQGQLGGLDVLVNNAGISGPTGRVEDLALDDIRRTLDINLMGQFLVLHATAPLLRQSAQASVINVSSVAGRLGYAMRTPYAATKWGIVGLTASLAREMGPEGIRVNAILPGVVSGPRMEGVIAARAEARGLPYPEVEAEYLANISLRRMVGPEDIAGMALYLCSPLGASISGQALSVCGNVETI